jgi:hypothetical protein
VCKFGPGGSYVRAVHADDILRPRWGVWARLRRWQYHRACARILAARIARAIVCVVLFASVGRVSLGAPFGDYTVEHETFTNENGEQVCECTFDPTALELLSEPRGKKQTPEGG